MNMHMLLNDRYMRLDEQLPRSIGLDDVSAYVPDAASEGAWVL